MMFSALMLLILTVSESGPQKLTDYAPVLPASLKRSINVNQERGYGIEKVKDGIFVISDGIWQSAAVVTEEGVVLLDAPESFGRHLREAVAEVTNQPIVTLVYSHAHSDHIGGAQYLKDLPNLEIVALESVAHFLRERQDPRRLLPTRTFSSSLVLNKGGKRIHLAEHVGYHSNEGDLFVSVPSDRFLMVIDVLAPGFVPFKNLDLSNNLDGYMKVFDEILAYDFDVFVSGHLGAIGTRADVIITQEYVKDLYQTVKRIHVSTDMGAVMAKAASEIGWDNKYLLFKVFLDKIIDDSATEINGRWAKRLAGVDVWSHSHAATMLNYVRWDD